MNKICCAIFLLALFSCKKDNGLVGIKKNIIGSWELRLTGGGISDTTVNYPSGSGRILLFNDNGYYQRKAHDTVVMEARYSLRKKEDCYERTNDIALTLGEVSSGMDQYIDIKNDTLYLETPNCYSDGTWAAYKRL